MIGTPQRAIDASGEWVPQAGEEEASVAPQEAASKEPLKERRPRVDFRGVAQEDVRLRHVRVLEVWRQAAGVGGP